MRRALLALFFALAFPLRADSVFVLPFAPPGASVNALGRGGLSKTPNAEMLFLHPACLADIENSDAAFSFNGSRAAEDLSAAVATRFSEQSALGLGYRSRQTGAGREYELALASAFRPSPLFFPGLSIRYLFGRDAPALDMDLSCAYNPFTRLRVAAMAENLLGSRLDTLARRSRGITAATQFYWTPEGVDGMSAWVRSDLEKYELSTGGGVEKIIFRNPCFALRAGGFSGSGDSAESGMTGGFLFRQKISEQTVAVEYAFQKVRPSGDLRHFVTLHFGLFGGRDRTPPLFRVKCNRERFSPNGDGIDDALLFRLDAGDNPGGVGLATWGLVIATGEKDRRRTQVKAFVGGGLPPTTIAWDGRNSQGLLVPSGDYYYRFIATDKNGNQAQSRWLPIRVE